MRKSTVIVARLVAVLGVVTLPVALFSCGSSEQAPASGATGGSGGDSGSDVSVGGDANNDGALPDGTGGDVSQEGAAGDGAPADGSGVDVKPNCELVGAACTTHSDCCSANCDPDSHLCTNPIAACKQAGEGCANSTECCTTVCSGGVCGATVCISDNQPCAADADCCSGTCAGTPVNADAGADAGADAATGKVCQPLNTACLTAGNACATHDECCSQLCSNGRCSIAPSFCTQTGDTCVNGPSCCSGVCTIAAGATLGTCTLPAAPGGTQCLVTGEVCGAGASGGGLDGGVPTCGGSCCSRACAPWGPTGVWICQPPSGCRPTGEVCQDDSDCCGSAGMPGGNGSVTCSKAAGATIGRCDNGNACRAAGSVCKLATSSCNAENNCCAGNVNQDPTVCQQDLLGIPRCTGVGDCADAGSLVGHACATSADCCGLPCLPNQDPNGSPFICGDSCAPAGAACTTDADCCAGLPCTLEPGSTKGVCGLIPGTDAGVDAGPSDGAVIDAPVIDAPVTDAPVTDAPPPDAGTPDASCALYGQQCTTSGDCCNGVPCTNGRCYVPLY